MGVLRKSFVFLVLLGCGHSSFAFGHYSINLMWINATPSPEQKYIYPAKDEGGWNDFIERIRTWTKLNPDATVNLWFDSFHISETAIVNTKCAFEKEPLFGQRIALRDVRDLPEVSRNPIAFSNKTPVFYRVDLARMIAAFNLLSDQRERHFVYGDIDMSPISESELFDSETTDNLNKFGFVFTRAAGNGLKFENGFFIFGNQRPKFLEEVRAHCEHCLQIGADYALGEAAGKKSDLWLVDVVFQKLPDVVGYFYIEEGWATRDRKDFLPTDPMVKRLEYNVHGKEAERLFYPTKIVNLPPSQFGGSPTRFDPDFITPQNYSIRLAEALKGERRFDNNLLYLAFRNNYLTSVQSLLQHRTEEEIADAIFGTHRFLVSPFQAAKEEGHNEILDLLRHKFQGNPDLLRKLSEK